jgi:hypothetical protein
MCMKRQRKNNKSLINFINDHDYNECAIEKYLADKADKYDANKLPFAILEYMSKKFKISKRELAVGILRNFLTFAEIGKIIGRSNRYIDIDCLSLERTRQIYNKLERKMRHQTRQDEFLKIFQEEKEIEILQKEINKLKGENERLLKQLQINNLPITQEEDQYKDILEQKIDYLELSVRSINCLKYSAKEPVIYVKDLIQYTAHDLMMRPNFGKKSLQEIEDVLKNHGLSLKS